MQQPEPQPPSSGPAKRRSLVPMLLVVIFLAIAVATLSLLTLGFAAVFVCVVLGLTALVAFHYFVWGWWLGEAIRREAEAEEGEEL